MSGSLNRLSCPAAGQGASTYQSSAAAMAPLCHIRCCVLKPSRLCMHAQGPGQKNPDVSFDLGPQDTPVKVTLGRQQALDGGVSTDAQVRPHSAALAI